MGVKNNILAIKVVFKNENGCAFAFLRPHAKTEKYIWTHFLASKKSHQINTKINDVIFFSLSRSSISTFEVLADKLQIILKGNLFTLHEIEVFVFVVFVVLVVFVDNVDVDVKVGAMVFQLLLTVLKK